MLIEFTVEEMQAGGHEPRRPIWVGTRTASGHHRGVAVQGRLRPVAAVTCSYQIIHERRQAESAWSTLLYRLSREP